MSNYGWIITRDVLWEEEAKNAETGCASYSPEVGVIGPRTIPDDIKTRLQKGEGQEFQLFDDDEILYYEGLFIGSEEEDAIFGPLHDFGMPNAGCVQIKYKNAQGNWEAL